MNTTTSERPIPIDPEPFTIASFIFCVLGTISGVAGLVLQQRHQIRSTEQNTEEKRNQLKALLEQFESRLSMLDSQIASSEKLLNKNVNPEDMERKRFGFSQVELLLKPYELDTLYRIEANLCDTVRELIDLEIAILKDLADFQVKFEGETIDRSKWFRSRITRLTGGALSFKGGLEEVKLALQEGNKLIWNLKEVISKQVDED